jgi:transposase
MNTPQELSRQLVQERMIKKFVAAVEKNGFTTADIVKKTDLHFQTIYNFKKGWNISARTRKILTGFIDKYGK